MYCPYCDEGELYTAIIKKLEKKIYICEECDSIWTTDDISDETGSNFSSYMESEGLEALWSELCDVRKID